MIPVARLQASFDVSWRRNVRGVGACLPYNAAIRIEDAHVVRRALTDGIPPQDERVGEQRRAGDWRSRVQERRLRDDAVCTLTPGRRGSRPRSKSDAHEDDGGCGRGELPGRSAPRTTYGHREAGRARIARCAEQGATLVAFGEMPRDLLAFRRGERPLEEGRDRLVGRMVVFVSHVLN